MRRRRDILYSWAAGVSGPSLRRNMAEVPCAGTGEKSIEKGDVAVIFTSHLGGPDMAQQITYDKAYDTVAPEDFAAMLEVPRYGRRTDAFDGIISATHDHFWDPLDSHYIDFDQPFDMTATPVMPLDTVVELRSAVADRLDDRQKIRLGNDVMHWSISNLLHGEQGALSLSASLCHILVDPGAQEYAANQAREEARHVAGFTRYIAKRWGEPLPVGKTIATVLADLVTTPEVYKKIVGMQMLIEGL